MLPRHRDVPLFALIASLALAACSPAPEPGSRGGPERPNVVLVVMDTARADRCSVNGYRRPTTPNLARFSRDAVVFADAWSPSPWTAPSHASIVHPIGATLDPALLAS